MLKIMLLIILSPLVIFCGILSIVIICDVLDKVIKLHIGFIKSIIDSLNNRDDNQC